jgi:hypothetical protein
MADKLTACGESRCTTLTGAYHEKGTDKGKGYEYRDRLTDIWMNYNAGWRLVASHYSLSSSH